MPQYLLRIAKRLIFTDPAYLSRSGGRRDNRRAFGDNLRMTAEQVRKAREKAPFKPFTIYLSDQRHFQVPHQDFIWIVPGGGTIGKLTKRAQWKS